MPALDYVQIGKLIKPHGLKGEINFSFTQKHIEKSGFPDFFFVLKDGSYLPYFINHLQLTIDKNGIIQFEDVNSRQQAAVLANSSMFLSGELAEKHFTEEKDDIETLLGYKIVVKGQELGTIEDIYEINGQLTIQTFIEKKEVLIPLVDDFIMKIDRRKKNILLQLPEGLLNIYLN